MKEDDVVSFANILRSVLDKDQNSVAQICNPLFNNTPLDYFDYTAYFDTGEIIAFSTDPRLHSEVYKYDLLPHLEEFDALSSFELKFTFLTHLLPLPSGTDTDRNKLNITKAQKFKIFNRVYYINRYNDRYITAGFGEKNESKSIFNFYLNNTHKLESFIKYFERSAEELFFENITHNKIILPHYLDKTSIAKEGRNELSIPNQFDFFTPFKQGMSQITQRQYECLELIARGHTMKSAVKLLSISPRTVEMHLNNIKQNHKLLSKQELINLWHTYYSK